MAETITPTFVSPTVARVPAGSFPSSSADTINGGGRGDTVSAGGGNDVIHDRPEYLGPVALTPNDGNAVHGDAGNDDITIEIGDTDGANPASNVAYGDDGNDSVTFLLSARNYPDGPWEGSAPSGTVSLYGGAGDDAIAVRGYYVGGAPGMTVHQYGGSGNDELFATAEEYDPDGSVTGSNNNDYLYGGTGNDEYTVIEAKDLVIELAGQQARRHHPAQFQRDGEVQDDAGRRRHDAADRGPSPVRHRRHQRQSRQRRQLLDHARQDLRRGGCR